MICSVVVAWVVVDGGVPTPSGPVGGVPAVGPVGVDGSVTGSEVTVGVGDVSPSGTGVVGLVGGFVTGLGVMGKLGGVTDGRPPIGFPGKSSAICSTLVQGGLANSGPVQRPLLSSKTAIGPHMNRNMVYTSFSSRALYRTHLDTVTSSAIFGPFMQLSPSAVFTCRTECSPFHSAGILGTCRSLQCLGSLSYRSSWQLELFIFFREFHLHILYNIMGHVFFPYRDGRRRRLGWGQPRRCKTAVKVKA